MRKYSSTIPCTPETRERLKRKKEELDESSLDSTINKIISEWERLK